MKLKKLLFAAGALSAGTSAYAGDMDASIGIQTYRDFAENRGAFAPGRDVTIYDKSGAERGVVTNMKNFDSIADTGQSSLVGSSQFVVGSVINISLTTGKALNEITFTGRFGAKTGSIFYDSYKIIKDATGYNADTSGSSTVTTMPSYDIRVSRLNKVVTEAIADSYATDSDVLLNLGDYQTLNIDAGDTTYSNSYVTLDPANKYLTAGATKILSLGRSISATNMPGVPASATTGYLTGNSYLLSSVLPLGYSDGNLGGPIYVLNGDKWEFAGLRNVDYYRYYYYSSGVTYYYYSYSTGWYTNPEFIAKTQSDYTSATVNAVGASVISWNKPAGDGKGTLTQDGNTWNYVGLAAGVHGATSTSSANGKTGDDAVAKDDALAATRDLVFDGSGGTIVLKDSVDLGAGSLTFAPLSQFTLDNGGKNEFRLNSAGFIIEPGATVTTRLIGVAGDEWRVIGGDESAPAKFIINGTSASAADLNVGGNIIVELNNHNGALDSAAVRNIKINGGNAIVRLMRDDQFTGRVVFGHRGGILDVNGHSANLTGSGALDSGAYIVNMTPNTSATITVSSGQAFYGSFIDGGAESNGLLNIIAASGSYSGNSRIAGSVSVKSGTVKLTGYKTPHAGADGVGTHDTLPDDWSYASLKTDAGVRVQSGTTFMLGDHARLDGDVVVDGGKFIFTEGVFKATAESIDGGPVGTPPEDLYGHASGKVTLQGKNAVIEAAISKDTDQVVNYSRQISGTGTFNKTGDGALTLSGINTFTGTTNISAGSIILQDAAGLGKSTVEVASGCSLVLAASGIVENTISLNGSTLKSTSSQATLAGNLIIGNSGATILSSSSSALTIAGIVSGVGPINIGQSGTAGKFIFANNNSFFGRLVIETGNTLQFGTGTATGSLGMGAVTNNGKIIFNRNDNYAFSNSISGTGTVEKIGPGVLSYSGKSAYTGDTSVLEGTLKLTGSLAGDLAVATGAALDGSGAIGGNLVIGTSGTGNISLKTDLARAYSVGKDLVLNDTLTINISGDAEYATGLTTILTYSGQKRGSGSVALSFADTNTDVRRQIIELIDNTTLKSIQLNVTSAPGNLTWAGTAATGNWTKQGTNWTGGPSGDNKFYAYDRVAFTDTAENKTVNVAADFIPAAMTIANSAGNDYTFTGTGKISQDDNGVLKKTGAGKAAIETTGNKFGTVSVVEGFLILSGDNTVSGQIFTENTGSTPGVLQVGTGGTTGSITGTAAIINNGEVRFDRSNSYTVANTVSGNGSLQHNGTGTLILTGNNTYAGTTTISAGTLQVGNGGNNGSIGTGDVLNNGALVFNRTGITTVSGAISGTGNLTQNGTGTLILAGNNTYAGTTIINAGALQVGNGDTTGTLGAGDVTNKGNLAFNRSDDYTVTNAIKGKGGSGAQNGLGTLFFNNTAKEFPAGFSVNAGTLALQGTTLKADTFVASGATLAGNGIITGNLINSGTISPGFSIGAINITGDFQNTGTLRIEINSAGESDIITYAGKALAGTGKVAFVIDPTFQHTQETAIPFIEGAGVATLLNNITVTGALGGTVLLDKDTSRLLLSFDPRYYTLSGLNTRSDLNDMVRVLSDMLGDGIISSTRLANSPDISRAIIQLSPLGLAAVTQMTVSMTQDDTAALHNRLESRRFERGTGTSAKTGVAAYFIGEGTFVDNGGSSSSGALFDYNTYGGLVGLDGNITEEILVGVNAGYHNGRATIHDGGGKITQDNAQITAYTSIMLTDSFYVDAAVFGGYSSYDVKRSGEFGNTKGTPAGSDLGASLFAGTVVPLSNEFCLTPFAGFEYTHAMVDGFTEKGGINALKVDEFTQDSLRAKIGTGINWTITQPTITYRLSLNLAYAHEFLDKDTDIDACFANDPERRKFSVAAPATERDSVIIGPAVEFYFGDGMGLTFSYNYESDLKDSNSHHINASFRARF